MAYARDLAMPRERRDFCSSFLLRRAFVCILLFGLVLAYFWYTSTISPKATPQVRVVEKQLAHVIIGKDEGKFDPDEIVEIPFDNFGLPFSQDVSVTVDNSRSRNDQKSRI